LFIIANVFSSTKLEKRAEQDLPGSKGVGSVGRGKGSWGQWGRDGPNNVYTYEYMSKQ
jgi:hypothetical protein